MVLLMYYAAKHGKEYLDNKKHKAVQQKHHQSQDEHIEQLTRMPANVDNLPPPRPPHPSTASNVSFAPPRRTDTGSSLPPEYTPYPVLADGTQQQPAYRPDVRSGAQWSQTPTFVIHEAEPHEEDESIREAASSRSSSRSRNATGAMSGPVDQTATSRSSSRSRNTPSPTRSEPVARSASPESQYSVDDSEPAHNARTGVLTIQIPPSLRIGVDPTRDSSISYHGSDCNGEIATSNTSPVYSSSNTAAASHGSSNANPRTSPEPQQITRQPSFPEILHRPKYESQQRAQLEHYARQKAQTDQEERDLLIALQTMNLDFMHDSARNSPQEFLAPIYFDSSSPAVRVTASSPSSLSSSSSGSSFSIGSAPSPTSGSPSTSSSARDFLAQYGPGRRTGRAMRRMGVLV